MDEVKDQTKQEEKDQQDYADAWDEFDQNDQDDDSQKKGGEDDEGLPKKEEARVVDVKSPPVSKDHGTIESLEKALHDTKSYASKLEQEKRELEAKIKAFGEGEATQEDIDAQRKAVKDAEDNLDEVKTKIYEDYPELKDLIDPLIESNRLLKKEILAIKKITSSNTEEKERVKALENFNVYVKPTILKVHPDYDAILGIDSETGKVNADTMGEYIAWAEMQSPALKTAALNSPDPKDIVWAISEYKKFKRLPEAEKLRSTDTTKKRQNLIDAQTLRGGSGDFPAPKNNKDKNDYDAGWEEAGKVLEQGGGAR